MSKGIDVSNNNGHVDWPAVKAGGVDFAVAKVSEGTWFRDSYFPENWKGMKDNGLLRGAYHFARPSRTLEPQNEANYFLKLLNDAGGLEPGDLVVLDMEDANSTTEYSRWTLDWLTYVHSQVGFPPILYTGPWYLSGWMYDRPQEIAQYPLWLAAYQSYMPICPQPWTTYLMWQYGIAANQLGILGDVDLDSAYNLDDLRAHGKPDGVPSPVPAATFAVGSGLLKKMEAIGDKPASNEMYGLLWSSAKGGSGLTYVYYKNTGEIGVYPPT